MAIIRMKSTTKVSGKATTGELLMRKAARALRALSNFLALASPRRRTAMAAGYIRALSPHNYRQGHAPGEVEHEQHGVVFGDGVGLAELLLQEVLDDDGGYPDWTHSMFHEEEEDGQTVAADEDDGEEFDVDHAAGLYIRRVRGRINNQCRMSF